MSTIQPSDVITFKPGDQVAYSARWMRNCGIFLQYYADLRGTILHVHSPRVGLPDVATVLWRDGSELKVLLSNLVLASRVHLEPR